MFTLIGALKEAVEKNPEENLVFNGDTSIQWTRNLDLLLQGLGYEIQEDGEPKKENEFLLLTQQRVGTTTHSVLMYTEEGKQYIDFNGVVINKETWYRAAGYENVTRHEFVEANEKDNKLAKEDSGESLKKWLFLLFESNITRFHILGLNEFGIVVKEIQIPDDSEEDPAEEADYQSWLHDAQTAGVLSNFSH